MNACIHMYKDIAIRSVIVDWKFHGTFEILFNVFLLSSRYQARAAASRCSSFCRLMKPQITFSKLIILQTNCEILHDNIMPRLKVMA